MNLPKCAVKGMGSAHGGKKNYYVEYSVLCCKLLQFVFSGGTLP